MQFNLIYSAIILCLVCLPCHAKPSSPPKPEIEQSNSAFSQAQEIVLYALSLVDIDYKYGGVSREKGFDCSGLVYHVYHKAVGMLLPRSTHDLEKRGQKISRRQLQPGDLVFYNTRQRLFSHVGIYLGNNRFIHAPSKGKEVRIDNMNSSYWIKRFNGARRFISNSTTYAESNSEIYLTRDYVD